MWTVNLPETITRHPHASLFVLFISAFTLFAVTGEENDLTSKTKKKKNLLNKLLHTLIGSRETEEEEGNRSGQEDVKAILSSPTTLGLADACKEDEFQNIKTRVRSFIRSEEPLDEEQRAYLEQLIDQLQNELEQERGQKEMFHNSMKMEEQLRLSADENLEMMRQEMNTQAKALEKERNRAARLEQENREQLRKIAELQYRLQEQSNRVQELEQVIEEKENMAQAAAREAEEKMATPPLLRSRSTEKKRGAFTII